MKKKQKKNTVLSDEFEKISDLIPWVIIGKPCAEPSWGGLKTINTMEGLGFLCQTQICALKSWKRMRPTVGPA